MCLKNAVMRTKDKALALIKKIRLLASQGRTISFHGDFGHDLTILIDDQHFHTYNGIASTDEQLIDTLYDELKYPIYEPLKREKI